MIKEIVVFDKASFCLDKWSCIILIILDFFPKKNFITFVLNELN